MRNRAESAGHGAGVALCEEGHRLWCDAEPGMGLRGSSWLASLAAMWVLQSCISPTAASALGATPIQG